MLSNMTVEELKEVKEKYISKYIGDFKPENYYQNLRILNRLIRAKE